MHILYLLNAHIVSSMQYIDYLAYLKIKIF